MTLEIFPLSFDLLNLESVERKGNNYKKMNILRTSRAFFIVFKGISFDEKIKNGRHKLKFVWLR